MKESDFHPDLETTVPTDLTISSVSDQANTKRSERIPKRNHSETIRREYLREIQLLKSELSRKNIQIVNLQSEMKIKTKDLEEKLKDAAHQKQLNHAKLVTHYKLSEEGNTRKIVSLQKELDKRNNENKNWLGLSYKLRQYLDNVRSGEEPLTVHKLSTNDAEELQNFVMLKIGDIVKDLKRENMQLKSMTSDLQQQLPRLQRNLKCCEEDLKCTSEENMRLKENTETLRQELVATRFRFERGNFAVENFDRIKSERDLMQQEILDLERAADNQEIQLIKATQELDIAKEEKGSIKDRHDELEKKCTYLTLQLSDAMQKWGESRDVAQRMKSELENARSSKEDVLHQFINFRDKLKTDYEERLALEISRVKISVIQKHEAEKRALTESKMTSLQEKEEIAMASAELRSKYEKLYSRFQGDSADDSNKIKSLMKELDGSRIEEQKALTNVSRLQASLKEKLLDCEKLSIKLQLTEKELDSLRLNTNERLRALETELGTTKARLEVFEKMESQIDLVINEVAQAGEISDEALDSIADQISLPGKARYSFNKCVHLTQKSINLERLVDSHKEKLAEAKSENQRLTDELARAEEMLDSVDQPYSYLISNMRESETNTRNLRLHLASLEERLEKTQKENETLIEERDTLTKDLETVMENREQISKIKKELTSLQCHQRSAFSWAYKSKENVTESNVKKKKTKPKWK